MLTLERNLASNCEFKHALTIQPSNPDQGTLSIQNLYVNIYSSFICYHAKLETAQVSFSWQMDTVVHPYSGIVLNNQKQQTKDTCNNRDESHSRL